MPTRLIAKDNSQEFHGFGTLLASMRLSSYRMAKATLNRDNPVKDFNAYMYDDGTAVTLLYEGVRYNNTGSVTALIEKLKLEQPQTLKELLIFRSNDEYTPLLAAAAQGCLENVTQLIACGADLCTQTNTGSRKTILQKAATTISTHSLMYYGSWDKTQSDPTFAKKLREFERDFTSDPKQELSFPEGNHTVQWNAKHQAELVKTILTACKNAYLVETDAIRKANLLNTLTNFSNFFQAAIKNPQSFFYNPDPQAEFQIDSTPGNPEQLCFSTYLINIQSGVKRSPSKIKVKVDMKDFLEYTHEVNATLKETFEAIEKLTGTQIKALAEIHQSAAETQNQALRVQQETKRTQELVENKLAHLDSKESEIKAKTEAMLRRQQDLEEKEKMREAKDQKEDALKKQAEDRKKQIEAFRNNSTGTRSFFDRIDKRFRNRTRAAGNLEDGMVRREEYAKGDKAATMAGGLVGIFSSTAGKVVSGGIKVASNKHEAGKHDRFVENVPSDEVVFCRNIAFSLTYEYQVKLLTLNQDRANSLGKLARDLMYETLAEKVYHVTDTEMENIAVNAVKSSKKFQEALESAYQAQLKENAKLQATTAKQSGSTRLHSYTAYTTAQSQSQNLSTPVSYKPLAATAKR